MSANGTRLRASISGTVKANAAKCFNRGLREVRQSDCNLRNGEPVNNGSSVH